MGNSDSRRLVRTSVPGIYRRGPSYVVTYRDPNGRQRKKSAKTLAAAKLLKATVTADVARGEYTLMSRVRFRDYASEWVRTYQGRTSRGFRDSTRKEYARDLGLSPVTFEPLDPATEAVAFFGKLRLSQIEPRDLKRYVVSLEERGLAPSSIARRYAPVRALLATAVEDGLIRSNPAAGIRLAVGRPSPDHADERADALTEDELRRLIAAVPGEWRLLVTFMVQTGLRISEVVGLQWGDIDFGTRRVRVRRAIRDGVTSPPKSRYGRRDVPISSTTAQALWEQRKSAQGDFVFTGKRGGRLDPGNVAARVLKPAARLAGVEWASFHTLRHTCATMLFRHGANAKQVQAWLGHHSPAFTLATYVHLLPDDLPDPEFFDAVSQGPAAAAEPDAGAATQAVI